MEERQAAEDQAATNAADAANAEAGFFPGSGFVLRTKDGNNKMHLGLQSLMHAQVTINGKAQVQDPFVTLRAISEGAIYRKWIRYWTSLELAANPVYLLDAYVEIQPIDEFGLRLGQQWTPISRHEYLYGPHQLLFPDWDVVSNYFWTGRDKGITAFGSFANQLLAYQVGAYLGSPLRQFQTIRGNYLFTARFELNPLGVPGNTEFAYAEKENAKHVPFKYAIGVNGWMSKANEGIENFNPTTFEFETVPSAVTTVNHGVGADLLLQSNRIMAQVEWYFRHTNPHEGFASYSSTGGFGQLGYLFYKRKLDAAVRLSWADVNLDVAHDQTYGIELNSTWYFHVPNIAFKLRYGYGHQQMPNDDTGLAGGAPLILSVPHVHVMTAQINTSF
ncbi:hypothetical protein AKJ09_05475 [Labilithrix luteola]|uniref:Porin n=1 Tax=Labilithrix luteola TaxID=1391654 RepID=A0A0K1PZK6_9BACT|nr:hypothetical protein [Labilithrix luteola]AKU98811.1 hypothetical protein AKJ09_05475 [Labilithrix luteola]